MTKEIKGFITRDDFITPNNNDLSPIFEISDIGLTFSKNRQEYYSSIKNNLYSLHIFNTTNNQNLSQDEVEDIVDVIAKFTEYLSSNIFINKQQTILLFCNDYNSLNPSKPIFGLNYNSIVSHNSLKSIDYITFNINNMLCSIWLSDVVFKAFYPDYDINIVLPFDNFASIANNTSAMITAVDNFNLIDFNVKIEENKNNLPTTYTKIMNIPYKVPNTTVLKNCYFAFNIYGSQGNYDYILKLELYNHLVNNLGLNGDFIESVFPSILNINEFFIIPRWDKIAIPSQVGQNGISSQVSLTYNEPFDIGKFIKLYNDTSYLRTNTYNVPFDYNNILLQITNGYYSDSSIKDFRTYYGDLITVSSTHPDFARMKQKTQRFITLIENMIDISNSSNSTEMFNKILQCKDYQFTIITRQDINYISFFYGDHQYYMISKYQFLSLL